jgi:LDH2 family malate/lactate/ureidoglycolate dehydrogenase
MSDAATPSRYRAEDLHHFTVAMLTAVGVAPELAEAMAARVVDGDLLGHRTHGLFFLPIYLDRISGGHIRGAGDVTVVADHRGSFTWQGNRLPGAWVMAKATTEILTRIIDEPIVTAAIADCSHIGCLQSYLIPFTDKGLIAFMAVSNPGVASVAPFGGIDPVVTTNPIAMGIPTRSDPVLIDQCTSVASNAFFDGYASAGKTLPEPWLIDADGQPSVDPALLSAEPPGSIMPLGGEAFGYKGFAFAMMVEAWALALPGYGRRSKPNRFGQGVFLQVIDPAKFAGDDEFLDETDHLVQSIGDSRQRADHPPVRLPGASALLNMRRQQSEGVLVADATFARLGSWIDKLQIDPPKPI